MTALRVRRSHGLAHEELRSRVELLAVQLVERYGGDYRWQGDRVRYRRLGGVDAEIHCGGDALWIEITLGPLAGFLRGTIERELNVALDRYLPSA